MKILDYFIKIIVYSHGKNKPESEKIESEKIELREADPPVVGGGHGTKKTSPARCNNSLVGSVVEPQLLIDRCLLDVQGQHIILLHIAAAALGPRLFVVLRR